MQSLASRHEPVSSKLSVPRLGRVFDRERLFQRLDEHGDSPGVWLAAPPGAGKTTLVASWLRRRETPTLWFELDTDDADPVTFAHGFDALLGAGRKAQRELPPFRGDDLSDLSGWLRRRLRMRLPQLPPRWTLVLDNHQELHEASPLHGALSALLTELPGQAQCVFISRTPPGAAYSRALARQQLALVDADWLRLDDAETLALVRLHSRPDTTAPALAAAQGWAAGMTLMLLGRPRDDMLPSLQANERLFDYFASEVLAQMSAEQQRCLCLLAHLPSVTSELALAVTGNPEAVPWLESLAAMSLFTDRREGPPPRWVFHALFGEFLRRHHERRTPEPQQRALLQRIGTLLVDAGDIDAGLQRLAQAHAWDLAESCIRDVAPRYLAQSRAQVLRQHIDALPAAYAERLAYWRGCCAIDVDPAAALLDMQSHLKACIATGDVDGQLAAAAGAATVLVSTSRLRELDPWIAVFTANAEHVRQVQGNEAGAQLVPGLLAALVHHAPWHPLVPALVDRGEQLVFDDAAGGQRLLLGALIWYFLWVGQLERLDRLVQRIDALCRQGMQSPAALLRWWSSSVIVKTLLGRTDDAAADITQALALTEAQPAFKPRRVFFELQAMLVALARVDAAAAQQHFERAGALLHPDAAVDRAGYEIHGGLLALFEGDSAKATRLAQASVVTAFRSGWAVREQSALLTLAMTAAHGGEQAMAQHNIEQAMAHPMQAVCRWHDWVGGCIAAYAALQRGDAEAAADALALGLGAARKYGYRFGPMLFLCGNMMSRLAAFALARGIEPEVALDLIRRHKLEAPDDAGEHWPWPVRVRVCGPLDVEVDGAPMPASRKESRRLLELLRLLAAHGGQAVAQTRIADALWPDADGDAARNALDNLVHRLRKALGGEARLLLRQGALALNPRLCWVDTANIERVLARVSSAAPKEIEPLARRLHELYRAPLAPDSELPLVVGRRVALHRKLQRALAQCAQQLDAAGMADAAAAAREPLPELAP